MAPLTFAHHALGAIGRRKGAAKCGQRRGVRSQIEGGEEAGFVRLLREASRDALSARNLGIKAMEWKARKLRVYVTTLGDLANEAGATGATIEDCRYVSDILDTMLDDGSYIESAYTLEVSTPGSSEMLEKEREFVAFRGFRVVVKTSEPFKKQTELRGALVMRTDEFVCINVRGRRVQIPREIVEYVRLQ